MHHPDSLVISPEYGALSLKRLVAEFDQWLRGRSKPVKAVTRVKYAYSLDMLFRSMETAATPLELRYLHPYSINQWVGEARERGESEDGIASNLSAVKVFANSFVYKHVELTQADPLRKVPRITPPDKEMDVLDEGELEALLASYGDITFEDLRNRAFVAVLVGTGVRLREIRELTMDQYERVSGELTLYGKGTGFAMPGCLTRRIGT
jgi:site-specific recombinase XerD